MERPERTVRQESTRLRRGGYTLLGMTWYVLYTALAILSLSTMNFETALDRLQSSRRRGARLRPGTSREALRRVLQEIVIRSSAEDVANWGDRHRAPHQGALRTATRLLRRKDLVRAVARANYLHVRPMSSEDVVNLYNNANDPTSSRGSLLRNVSGPHIPRSSRGQWTLRWRRQHGVRFGRIRFGEPISIPEKRRKVLAKSEGRPPDPVT